MNALRRATALAQVVLVAAGGLAFGPAWALAGEPTQAKVIFNDRVIRVVVADTPELQILGLGGRRSLAPDEGMLFVYPEAGDHAFWMRGMLIPIDMIWLQNRRVVHIEAKVPPPEPGTPDRALTIYRSPEPGNMVLEIAAGRAAELGIVPGSRLRFDFAQP